MPATAIAQSINPSGLVSRASRLAGIRTELAALVAELATAPGNIGDHLKAALEFVDYAQAAQR